MGLLEDPFVIMMDAFFAAILLGIGYFIILSMNGTGLWSAGVALDAMTAIINGFSGLDWLIAIGFVMYAIASIALAYFIPSNPIFFINYFCNLVFLFIFTPQISNAYAMIATNPTVAVAFAAFPRTAWFIGNMPIIVLVFMTVLAIATYGKTNQAGAIAQG